MYTYIYTDKKMVLPTGYLFTAATYAKLGYNISMIWGNYTVAICSALLLNLLSYVIGLYTRQSFNQSSGLWNNVLGPCFALAATLTGMMHNYSNKIIDESKINLYVTQGMELEIQDEDEYVKENGVKDNKYNGDYLKKRKKFELGIVEIMVYGCFIVSIVGGITAYELTATRAPLNMIEIAIYVICGAFITVINKNSPLLHIGTGDRFVTNMLLWFFTNVFYSLAGVKYNGLNSPDGDINVAEYYTSITIHLLMFLATLAYMVTSFHRSNFKRVKLGDLRERY